MSRLTRGLVVAALHLALVMTLVARYEWDRSHLPRVWAKTMPFDPDLPIRGRYVALRVLVEAPDAPAATGEYQHRWGNVRLTVENQQLIGRGFTESYGRGPEGAVSVYRMGNSWTLSQRIPYFIPEHVPDPSTRPAGEELWVEMSIPPTGIPRPIRLGVKKDGVLTPLDLR